MRSLVLLASCLLITLSASSAQSADTPWKGSANGAYRDPKLWSELIDDLKSEGLYFGAVASAQQIFGYFQDVETRELAYRTIIEMVDLGYPFSVIPMFQNGEVTPAKKDHFASTYYTYRGILAEQAGNQKWVEDAYRHVDQEKTPAFIFHKALEDYAKANLDPAAEGFRKILALAQGVQDRATGVKAARDLARVLFEQKKYAEAHAIYRDLLLRLNPMFASDWLEAAWAAYYLQDYPTALGYLYNLESVSTHSDYMIEKYLLRGLIYKDLCAENELGMLLNSFNRRFKTVLDGIRSGKSYAKFAVLRSIESPKVPEFQEVHTARTTLIAERQKLRRISSDVRGLADSIYVAEINRLTKRELFLVPAQANAAAEQLLTISKSLDFLKFELERSKYRPELAFTKKDEIEDAMLEAAMPNSGLVENTPLAWKQTGDFWRYERMDFRAKTASACEGK